MNTKLTVCMGDVLTFFIGSCQFSVDVPVKVGLRDCLDLVGIEVVEDLHGREITWRVVIGNNCSSRLHMYLLAPQCIYLVITPNLQYE